MRSRGPQFRTSPKPWKTLGTRKLIDMGEVKLHQDRIVSKSGFRATHLRLSLNDFSIIVPVLDDNRLVFIWNYRHSIQGWELELPAGLVDDREGPEGAAKRELKEETGYSAKSWKNLGWLHTLPGISSQRAHVFLARNLKKGSVHREPYEYMKLRVLKATDAFRLLSAGRIVHSPTVSALAMAARSLTVKRR